MTTVEAPPATKELDRARTAGHRPTTGDRLRAAAALLHRSCDLQNRGRAHLSKAVDVRAGAGTKSSQPGDYFPSISPGRR